MKSSQFCSLPSLPNLPGSLRFPTDACMLLSELALPIRIWRGPCPPIEVGSQKREATGEVHISGVYLSAQFPPLSFLFLTSSSPRSTSLPSSRVKPPISQTGMSGVGGSGIRAIGSRTVSNSSSGSGERKGCWLQSLPFLPLTSYGCRKGALCSKPVRLLVTGPISISVWLVLTSPRSGHSPAALCPVLCVYHFTRLLLPNPSKVI